MRKISAALSLASLLLALGCADQNGLDPTPGGLSNVTEGRGPDRVAVLSRNLYVGTDVDAVIAALATPDPNDDLPALLGAIQTLQATDFPSRVHALADEIEFNRPHIIGLQEGFTLDVDLTPLGLPVVIHQNFLPSLVGELQARGLPYGVATSLTTTQAAPFPGISLVDHDAILVDQTWVTVLGTAGQLYNTNLGTVAPGVTIVRGWVAVNAEIGGSSYTFVNTHLESGGLPQIVLLRAAQALELMQILGTQTPVVLLGDLNDVAGSPMYQVVSGAGFEDVWHALRPGAPGFTCCHASDLSNRVSVLDQRIDYVFARGVGGKLQGSVTILGDTPSWKVAGPVYRLWPSDHGGLAAVLKLH